MDKTEPKGEKRNLSYWLLKSKRQNGLNIAAGISEFKRDSIDVHFEINGTYFPRLEFQFPDKTLEESDVLEIWEINRQSTTGQLYRGLVDFSKVTPDLIQTVITKTKKKIAKTQIENVENNDEEVASDDVSDEEVVSVLFTATELKEMGYIDRTKLTPEQVKELDRIEAEKERAELERIERLELEDRLAERDDQIESDEDDVDSLDEYQSKYDADHEVSDPEDNDYEENAFDVIFDSAPFRFHMNLADKGVAIVYLEKDEKQRCFALRSVKISFPSTIANTKQKK